MGFLDILEGNSAWDFNSDIYKSFILFIDIFSSLLAVSIQIAVGNEDAAKASLGLFGCFAILSLIVMSIIAFLILVANWDDDDKWIYLTMDIFIIFATLTYYVGDNLPPILATFSEELSCDETCIEQVQTAGRCLLFIALICFNVVPRLLRKWLEIVSSSDGPNKISGENYLAASFLIHMLALMVEYDAIYTVIWGNNSNAVDGACNTSDLVGSWFSWAFSFFIWTTFVVMYFFFANKGCGGEVIKDLLSLILMIIALFLVCGMVGIYLLGDNDEPIGCVCSGGGVFNSTMIDTSTGSGEHNALLTGCSEITGLKIRSGLMGVTLGGFGGIVTIISVFLLLGYCN